MPSVEHKRRQNGKRIPEGKLRRHFSVCQDRAFSDASWKAFDLSAQTLDLLETDPP